MLTQHNWNAAAEAAFQAAYGDDAGMVAAHREDVEAGREILLNAGAFGWVTARLEHREIVITGAAGSIGGFAAVLATLEANYAVVFVETFRKGLVKLLGQRGYALDHVRMFKRVQQV